MDAHNSNNEDMPIKPPPYYSEIEHHVSMGFQALNMNANALESSVDKFQSGAVGGGNSTLDSSFSFAVANTLDSAFKKAMVDGDYSFVSEHVILIF